MQTELQRQKAGDGRPGTGGGEMRRRGTGRLPAGPKAVNTPPNSGASAPVPARTSGRRWGAQCIFSTARSETHVPEKEPDLRNTGTTRTRENPGPRTQSPWLQSPFPRGHGSCICSNVRSFSPAKGDLSLTLRQFKPFPTGPAQTCEWRFRLRLPRDHSPDRSVTAPKVLCFEICHMNKYC